MWVVTAEHNEYDQYGEYFVAAYSEKPTVDQLNLLGLGVGVAEHLVVTGGGRQKVEYQWFFLKEVEEGKNYHD